MMTSRFGQRAQEGVSLVSCAERLTRRSTTPKAVESLSLRAAGRVALGSYPPRASTDPDVRTLAHPVPQPTASPSAMVPAAI
jgi:hypothetical protein